MTVRFWWGSVLVASLGACAARGPSPQVVAALSDADGLVRQGCYRCLEDAVGRLTAHTAPASTAPAAWANRLFEAQLLLALRQRELGINASAAFAAARSTAASLPAPGPGEVPATTVLDLAELVPADATTLMLGLRTLPYPQWRTRVSALVAEVSAMVPGSRLATYVAVSAACDDREMREAIDRTRILAAHPATPLLTYRLATCGADIDDRVAELRSAEARWHEASWFLGRRQLATSRDVRMAAALFADAASGLPEAPAVLLSLAGAQQALRQLEPALHTYDRLLAISPELRPALLGRVLCLTYLGRHEDAVATATRMIDLGTFMMGDAYYWRAWNRYQLRDVATAESDAEQALTLMANTNAFTLAGVIQYDLSRMAEAESRLLRARELDASNCQAVWYLGLIHSGRAEWKTGASDFASAVSCFTQAAATARAELAALERSPDPPEVKASAAAEHHQAIATNDLRGAQSAYNAGHCLAQAGDRSAAGNYLAIAAEHPELRAAAERLRAALKH